MPALYLGVNPYPELGALTPGAIHFSMAEVNDLRRPTLLHRKRKGHASGSRAGALRFNSLTRFLTHTEIQTQFLVSAFNPHFHLPKKQPNTCLETEQFQPLHLKLFFMPKDSKTTAASSAAAQADDLDFPSF